MAKIKFQPEWQRRIVAATMHQPNDELTKAALTARANLAMGLGERDEWEALYLIASLIARLKKIGFLSPEFTP